MLLCSCTKICVQKASVSSVNSQSLKTTKIVCNSCDSIVCKITYSLFQAPFLFPPSCFPSCTEVDIYIPLLLRCFTSFITYSGPLIFCSLRFMCVLSFKLLCLCVPFITFYTRITVSIVTFISSYSLSAFFCYRSC